MTAADVFACPRCHTPLEPTAFYGPCAPCRVELRDAADYRYVGWMVTRFLAGRLVEPEPAVAVPGGPGAPPGPSPRALDPADRFWATQGQAS